MNGIKTWLIWGTALFLMTDGLCFVALADHDEHENNGRYQQLFDGDDDHGYRERGRRRHRNRSRHRSAHCENECLTPVNNKTYIDECGACHTAYQPELLPFASWEKILAGLEDHFGETVDLDNESKKTVIDYVKTNSAEHSKAERAVKIMRSLNGNTPMRITEVPCIRRKHRKIGQDILKRESIGSLSNCSACHVTAEKGIYDDDYVRIPR